MHVGFDGGRLTSDGGILLLAAIEQRLKIAERLAACIKDPRDPDRVVHQFAEMIRYRALLIAAGYPDGNDCAALKSDPAFKMAVGRLPESGEDLCSQPTINRLENLPGASALKRMMAAMGWQKSSGCRDGDRLGRRLIPFAFASSITVWLVLLIDPFGRPAPSLLPSCVTQRT